MTGAAPPEYAGPVSRTIAYGLDAMAVLGVRVVATSGHRPSWLAALVRAVVLVYFPLGATWALVDRRHQAVHDKLARTAWYAWPGRSIPI